MDIWSVIGKWAAGLGGTAVIVGSLIWGAKLLATRWSERLLIKWQHEYDAQLEDLRAQISAREAVIDAALSSGSAAHLAAQERRVKAVEELWEAVLQLRNRFGTLLSPYQFLVPDEYDEAFNNPKVMELVSGFTERDVSNTLAEADKGLERLRPFFGQRLWVLFFVYRAFTGRMALKLIWGRDEKRIYPWNQDINGTRDYLPDMLRLALSEDELGLLDDQKFGIPQLAMDLLEQKIMQEADRVISGRSASEVTMEEWQRVTRLLHYAQTETAVDEN